MNIGWSRKNLGNLGNLTWSSTCVEWLRESQSLFHVRFMLGCRGRPPAPGRPGDEPGPGLPVVARLAGVVAIVDAEPYRAAVGNGGGSGAAALPGKPVSPCAATTCEKWFLPSRFCEVTARESATVVDTVGCTCPPFSSRRIFWKKVLDTGNEIGYNLVMMCVTVSEPM